MRQRCVKINPSIPIISLNPVMPVEGGLVSQLQYTILFDLIGNLKDILFASYCHARKLCFKGIEIVCGVYKKVVYKTTVLDEIKKKAAYIAELVLYPLPLAIWKLVNAHNPCLYASNPEHCS